MTEISKNEYDRDRGLDSIFAPYALRQRDEIYGDLDYSKLHGVSKRFVHYTTAEAALKIIKTKRFWMRMLFRVSWYARHTICEPDRNFDRAQERADIVLDAMVQTGVLSQQQADTARQNPAGLHVPPQAPAGSNYFVDTMASEVKSLVGANTGDLTIRTTLDRQLQQIGESVIAKRLAALGSAKNVHQAALIAMAPDGAILAMVGGRDYNNSQFNRATQARRQPGSLFKLFVYLAAMREGLTPETTVVDQPIQVGTWEPENYGERYYGPVTLRTAFAHSLNSVAVQLAEVLAEPRPPQPSLPAVRHAIIALTGLRMLGADSAS